jgi:hypothetical protein
MTDQPEQKEGFMKAPAGVIVALFLIPACVYGFGYLDAMGMGSPMPGTDPATQGFGGASTLDVGGMNLFGNPAELSGSKQGISLSTGALLLKQTVDDGMGRHTLTFAGLGATGFHAVVSAGSTAFAAGIAKVTDYTHKGEYFFVEALPDPVIAGYENIQISGGIWEAAVGTGVEISRGVKVGGSAGYRLGDINYEYYWHHFSESIPDSSSQWVREEGEFAWRGGASWEVSPGTTLGAAYSSASENSPASGALGIKFGDMAEGNPGFGFEGKLYDSEESNSWRALFYGGVYPEHNLFFRGGLSLYSRGGSESNATLGISLGTRVRWGAVDIDGAFVYAQETRSSGVFGFPEAQKIDDIVTAFSAGITIPL